MSTISLTIMIAFIVVSSALALMGISWLITGKLRIKPGACGRTPTKRDDSCGSGTSCGLCEKDKK